MHLDKLVTILEGNGFQYVPRNDYTFRPRYVIKTKDFFVKGRHYYNSHMLLEVLDNDALFFAIRAYNSNNDKHEDITRSVFPGVYQYLYADRLGQSTKHLQAYRLSSASIFAL